MSSSEKERLLARCVVSDAGCWEWTAGRNGDGYGQTSRVSETGLKKQAMAHRVSYEAFVGPIPEGLQIDHLCRNRACINPDHLEPVTHGENVRRGIRVTSPVCINGHDRNGHSVCAICTGEWFIAHREERRAYQRAYYALGASERRRRKDAGLPVVTPEELAFQQEQGAVA